jgi:hypothetical protein
MASVSLKEVVRNIIFNEVREMEERTERDVVKFHPLLFFLLLSLCLFLKAYLLYTLHSTLLSLSFALSLNLSIFP